MNISSIPIEVTVVPDPIISSIFWRVCPTTIPVVVIPVMIVVAIPTVPIIFLTIPTKLVYEFM